MGSQALKSMRVMYDVANDVLYCYYDKAKEGVSFEVADGVLLRVDPNDEKQVVGFTVLDLRRRSLDRREFEVPLDTENLRSPA